MPLPANPQRVALATDKDGRPVYVTREWLSFFGQTPVGGSGGSGSSGSDAATIAALQAQISALNVRVVALEREVESLRIGYQL